MIVCKKSRNGNNGNILFIDASKEFQSGKNQNVLTDEGIQKILKAYQDRTDKEKFAHVADMQEIIDNDYNLNIPRYVDTFEEEEPVDIDAVVQDIQETEKEISNVSATLKTYFNELGLKFPENL